MSLRCSVFGIPSAVVSWWRGERLVANNSRLVHEWEEQFYRVVEHRANTHQVSGNEEIAVRMINDGPKVA